MAKNESYTQVAFVVDVSTCRQPEESWKEAICLCIFRVLCFLNNRHQSFRRRGEEKRKHLKWGCKLFDIDGLNGAVRSFSSNFKDFKRKTFDDFERDFMSVFVAPSTSGSSSVNVNSALSDWQNKCIGNGLVLETHSHQSGAGSKKRSELFSFPAKALSKCLTETLHDFPWEVLEIGSPIKKYQKQTVEDQDDKKSKPNLNLVFLISRVPCDKKTMRYYCNKVVIDKDVFLGSFMPELLHQELIKKRNIKIYWVDTGRYFQPNITEMIPPPDQSCHDIVEQCVRSMGGVLLPFHTFVTSLSGKRHFCNVSIEAVLDRSRDLEIPAFKRRDKDAALLATFSCMSACYGQIPKARLLTQAKPEVQHQVTLVLDSNLGDCCCQEFTLKLVPINIPPMECPQSCGEQSMQSSKSSPYRMGSPLRQTRQTTYHHRCQSLTRLEARATICKVRLRSLHLGLHASALCYVTSSASTDQRKAFSSLLGSLHLCQQALVMSAWVGSVSCVALSVLEAASPHSGFLSHLSVDMSLQVEKVLRPWSPLASNGTKSEAFLKFKDRAVNAVLENHRHLPLSLTVHGQAQNNIGSRMWVNCINPWHVSSNTGSLKYLMDKLANQAVEMHFLTEEEKNTLLDMRHAVWVDPLFQQLQGTPGLSPASAGSPFMCPRAGSDPGFSRESLSGSGSDSRCGLPNALSRGQLMVSKSRLVASQGPSQDEVDGDSIYPVITAATLSPDYISNLDLKSESEVGQYLQEQYDGVLVKGLGLETTVRTILTVTQHFIALKDTPSPQDSTVEYLRQRLLKSCRELKMFYQNAASEEDGKAKIIEFKLQILLRMEMESIVSGMDASKHDETVEEVVQYLRSLLFVTGAGEVPEFLTNVLLARYLTALPQMLVTIYEELQQPLPLELAAFDTSLASMAPSAFGPLSTSSRASFPPSSDFSLNPDSNQSSASQKTKTRNTICSHPVLTKQGPKRQIVVPKHVVKKSSKNGLKKKKQTKSARKSPAHKSPGKPLKQSKTSNISKAKRDLFNAKTVDSGAEKSASTPKKRTPRKKASSSGKRDRTFVVETPNHKQRSRLAYRREQVVKHYSKKGSHAVHVVAESPEKDIVAIQKSLLVKRPARHVLRQAFYSSKPEHDSRNLKRATESAGSMSLDHSQHHRVLRAQSAGRLSEALSRTEDEERRQSVLTPRRQHIRASFIKQLTQITSPEIASLPDQKGSVTPRRRSRTPLKGSRTPMRTPQQKLDCEMGGQSLPAWTTSVRARLNFTSPDKIGALPASQSISLPWTSPRPVTRSVTSASKMAMLYTPPSSKLKVVSRLDFSSAADPASMLSLATSASSKAKTPTKTEPNVQKGIRVKLPSRKKKYSKSVSDLKSTPQQQINTPHLSPAKHSALRSPARLSASCFARQSTLRSPARPLTSHSPSRYLNDRRAPTVTTTGSKLQSNCLPRSLENEFGCIDKVLDHPLCENSVPGTPPRNSHQSGLYGSARNNRKLTTPTKSSSQLAAAQSSSVINPSQPMYVKDKEATTPVKTRSQISALKSSAPINICFMQSTGSSEQTASSQKKSDMFTKQSPVKTCSLNKLTDTNSSLATETNRTLFNKLVTTSTRQESRIRHKPGNHEMKGVSPSQSSSSSNSQQSSILDYVSPVRKVNTAASDASLSVTPSRRGTYSFLLSSTKSPKPILKNSPHSSRSTTPFKVSCGTPHKVMFESNVQQKRLFATSSTDCLMGSQDAISKWPRKKRRNSNGSKSPQSDATPEKSPRKVTRSTDLSPARKLLETKVSVRVIRTENMSEMIATSESDRVGINPHKCRKRSLPQSEQTETSSAKKRCKTDSSATFSIDRPVSFSENAMDGSDFSPSHTLNIVAFGESHKSDEDIFTTPVKQNSKICKLTNSRSSHFSSGSPGLFPEGSQGFEVGTSNVSSFCSRSSSLPSGTFSSSPLLVSRAKTRKGFGAHFPTGVTDCRQMLQDQICQNSEKAVPESKKETQFVSIEAGVDKPKLLTPPLLQTTLDNSLTKHSARGTPQNLKFSPSVTTKSLVHLLNSPLLVNPTDRKRRIRDESSNRKKIK